jgi:transcription initiation factor TFIIE subunit alpha
VLSNKYVQDYISSRLGENSLRIIKAANTEMTDDALATKCKLKVSEIRSLLNKLHNLRLADYTRIKDKDTGWYSYIWRINLKGIYEVLDNAMQMELKVLETRLDESTTIFSFYCPKCSKENKIDFNTATQIEFKCPNCRRQLKADKGQGPTITDQLEDLRDKYYDFKTSVAEIKK